MTLEEFFSEYNRVALAFSGGTDSAYVLYCAVKYGADVTAYFVKTQFQPKWELEDATALAESMGIKLTVVEFDILSCPEITSNNQNRCYLCKRKIMELIRSNADKDGYAVVIDGTNADDDPGQRPGMRVLDEMNILSPLKICGISKAEVRMNSKLAGIFTWNKPAYACLATRITGGEPITAEKLTIVEKSETILSDMGFSDFRVRLANNGATLQFTADQQETAYNSFPAISGSLSELFESITLDQRVREKGT